MKKTYLFLLLVLLIMGSCKKKKDPAPAEEQPTINIPNGEFWMTLIYQDEQNKVVWTKDFQNYSVYNSNLKAAMNLFRSGNTLLVAHSSNQDYSLSYGDINNPSGFNKVTSSHMIYSAAYIDGVIVALAQDGNNHYRGYCKVKNGETSITFSLLPSNLTFQNLYYVGHAVISNVNASGSSQMGYTRDGISWTITSCPGSNGRFEYIDHKTLVKLNGSDYFTADTSYSSATWTEVQYDVNTTDTSGYFSPLQRRGIQQWWCYGTVVSTASGQQIPSINISTDQGQTWNTSFLSGITFPQSDQPKFFTLSNKVLAYYYTGGNVGKAFISSDGINFSEVEFSSSIEMLNSAVYFPG